MTEISQKLRSPIVAGQLVSVQDLLDFKYELLAEIKSLLTEHVSGKTRPKQWLKSKEVRSILQISPGTLLTLRANGTIPYTQVGGVFYYEYTEIEKVLTERKLNRKELIPKKKIRFKNEYNH